MHFHHIGIIVKKLSFGTNFYKKILNKITISKTIIDKNLGVKIKFIKSNDKILYELISPYGHTSPIKNSLKKNINIINHIAYKDKNFYKTILFLKKNNFIQISNAVKAKAFKGKKVVFFLTPLKHILELIED